MRRGCAERRCQGDTTACSEVSCEEKRKENFPNENYRQDNNPTENEHSRRSVTATRLTYFLSL